MIELLVPARTPRREEAQAIPSPRALDDRQAEETEVHTRIPRQWQTFPHVTAPTDPFAEHGRGLLLVDQLATTWGTLAPWQHGVYFHLTWTTNPPNHTT